METKFNIGDHVYALITGVVVYGPIVKIEIAYEDYSVELDSEKKPITYYYFNIDDNIVKTSNQFGDWSLCSTIEEMRKIIDMK